MTLLDATSFEAALPWGLSSGWWWVHHPFQPGEPSEMRGDFEFHDGEMLWYWAEDEITVDGIHGAIERAERDTVYTNMFIDYRLEPNDHAINEPGIVDADGFCNCHVGLKARNTPCDFCWMEEGTVIDVANCREGRVGGRRHKPGEEWRPRA